MKETRLSLDRERANDVYTNRIEEKPSIKNIIERARDRLT